MDESWPRRAMLAVRPGSSHRCRPASARLEIVPPLPARAKAAGAVTTVAGAAAAAHWELQLEVCPWIETLFFCVKRIGHIEQAWGF